MKSGRVMEKVEKVAAKTTNRVAKKTAKEAQSAAIAGPKRSSRANGFG